MHSHSISSKSENINREYPKVSVIILTYNGQNYIENLINSLLDQSYPGDRIEIVVIDNASTDATLSIVGKKFPAVRCVALEKNVGFAEGNNQAVRHARSDYLAFLNQDTICHHDWLSSLMDKLLEDIRIAACASNIFTIATDETSKIDRYKPVNIIHACDLTPFGYGRYRKIKNTKFLMPKLLTGCAFVIRKQLIEKMGYLFDKQLWMYAEDTDLSLRLHNLGYKLCIVRGSVVFHLHNTSDRITGRRLSMATRAIMNRVIVFYKNMDSKEFLCFYPILLLGGAFKILEFQIPSYKKILYFFPFGLFSAGCMIAALFSLSEYSARRRSIINTRQNISYPILSMLFSQLFR